MKSLFTLLLGVVLILSACGKKQVPPQNPPAPAAPAPQNTTQPPAQPAANTQDPKCQGNYAVVNYDNVLVQNRRNDRFAYAHLMFIFVPSHESKLEKVELEITDGVQTVRTPHRSSDGFVRSGIVNEAEFPSAFSLSLINEWGERDRRDYISRYEGKFFVHLNWATQRLVEGTNTYIFTFIREGCPAQRQEVRKRW